ISDGKNWMSVIDCSGVQASLLARKRSLDDLREGLMRTAVRCNDRMDLPPPLHVLDHDAAILHEVDARFLGERAGVVVADAGLEPHALRAGGNRLARHVRTEFAAP